MSIKKLYSNYQDSKLCEIEELQQKVNELLSYSEDYYIAQQDSYNQKAKEQWDEEVDNYRNYKDDYYKVTNTFENAKAVLPHLYFKAYNIFHLSEITGKPLSVFEFFSLSKSDIDKYLNPANIQMPEKPTLITDLRPFKEAAKEKVQEIESKIENLKTELSTNIPTSQQRPILLDNDDIQWLYKDSVYEIKGKNSQEEIILLIMEFAEKENHKFERLKNKFSGNQSDELNYERTRIPEEVRIAVWRRDQGRCARCGNRENLEYDHIVPVSKGGGNTERNIELLCQDCNRVKGNRIE